MIGPCAGFIPMSSLINVCVVVEPDPALGNEAQNLAVHNAALVVSDRLAAALQALHPPERDVCEIRPVDQALPKVVYIQCIHSPQAMSGSLHTFCTTTYGLTQLTPPWLFHPNADSARAS